MNFRIIAKTIGTIMLVCAASLLLPLMTAAIYRENVFPFVYTIAILFAAGFPLSRVKRGSLHFFTRDGFATVALAWLVLSLFGALPFYFSGGFKSYIDCVFEAVSGFTTTGATILTDIESLPRGILLWRSFTHFLGGMGILVLATALMHGSDDRAHHLMRAEVPGPTKDKLVPRLSQSSKILYGIYIALTILQVICLIIAGLSLFDSVNIAFATAGTGGFAVLNTSIAGYNNVAAEMITAVFMLVFATNFTVYFLIISGRWKLAIKNEEWRVFLMIVSIAVLLIMINLFKSYGNLWQCFRFTFFTVSSIISTTGFATVDHDLWPEFSKTIILFLMLFGACAGSTGGGLKTSRVIMVFKSLVCEIKQIIHPRSVTAVRLNGNAVESTTLTSVLRFFCSYFIIIFVVTLLISIDNVDFTTRFTAVISCMGNIGPGLGLVGPSGNFSFFSDFSKILLSLTMLIGRLEIFPILVLFAPSTWKRN